MNKRDLCSNAATAALRLRLRAGVTLTQPVNPIDLAERMGVEVWFKRLPSLEGMLIIDEQPVVLLSSLRPPGRVMFTCAHELGHLTFGHEGHLDLMGSSEGMSESDDEKEFMADAFAGYLLMPKTLVQFAFSQRSINPITAKPLDVLNVAQWLGVGYTTLVHHLRWNLSLIHQEQHQYLLTYTPAQIREEQRLSIPEVPDLLADRHWQSRTIDLTVGQSILLDGVASLSGSCVRYSSHSDGAAIVNAIAPGMGHIESESGWAAYVRVQRMRYEGRSIFRFQEEVEDEH